MFLIPARFDIFREVFVWNGAQNAFDPIVAK